MFLREGGGESEDEAVEETRNTSKTANISEKEKKRKEGMNKKERE